MSAVLSTLFIDPTTVGWWWYLLLGPLAAGVAVVYKALKVRNVREVPLAAAGLTVTILVGMAAAAAFLYLVYYVQCLWKIDGW